ncbi:MAG: branched-chain amino acid ABC transporter permease [Defluviitaleaceae bacterium]|nr:branched-chain amino acid ABC transporter permease [Defluviitaleaceae bacterium]
MKAFTIPTPVRYGINTALLILFLIAGNAITQSGLLGRAQNAIIIQVGFFIILAVSLNLVTGYLGQLPLGHAGFMAVGAYAGALFWRAHILPETLSIVVGLLLAGVVAALFGILIGVPALRLRGDYLAIITLGFGEIIRVVLTNLDSITYGARGLLNIPRHSSFLVVYICVIISCAVIHTLMKSRHGRAILSIRENEIAAESCGVKTTYYKVMAFAVSAFFAGIAGALFAGNLGILVPANFDFMTSINILMIVVLGGLGSMFGSVVAAAVLTFLPFVLQPLADYRMIIYSLMLIIVMIFKPSGLMGSYDFSLSRILEKVIGKALSLGRDKGGKNHGKA